MSIDLNAFRNIAGSDISIGYAVAKTDKHGGVSLEKAAAHRHLVSWNVTPADSESNASLRLSLYNLVQESLCATGATPQDALVKAFMERTARQLGCSLGNDGQMHAEARPLERRVIRSVLCGLDAHLAFFKKTDLSKLSPAMHRELVATFDETLGTVAMLASAKSMVSVKLREELTRAAQSLLGRLGLKDGDLTNVSTVRIQEMIILALDGRDLQTPEQLADLLEHFKFSSAINSEEIQNLVVKMDAVGQDELNHINDEGPAVNSKALSTEERRGIGMKVAAQAINDGVQAADKALSKIAAFVFGEEDSSVKVENPPVDAPKAQGVPFGVKVEDVQDMLADMVYDSDTVATDLENGNTGKHLADVLARHVKTLTACLIDRSLIAGLPEKLRGIAERVISEVLANKDVVAKLGELKPERADVIAFEIDLALKLKPVQDELGKLVTKMDETLDRMAGEAQEKINEAIDVMFPQRGNQAAQPGGPLTAQQMLGSGDFKTLNELVKAPEFAAEESANAKSSLQDKIYNEISVREDDGTVHTYISGEIAPADKVIGSQKLTSTELKTAETAVTNARAAQKKTRGKVGQMLINKMLEKTVQDTSSGYTAFMIGSLKTYLSGMGTMDKRAMVAAAFRYAKPDVKAVYPENATQEQKNAIDAQVARKNAIQLFGAMMKGAGPIMQKMLQGLTSATDNEDFLQALADMRSNLTPISPKIVKANLASMIADSNGKIKDITILKSLGAASVGQAFMCRLTLQDPKDANRTIQKEVVVKMLRPDAEQRMMREKAVFQKAAAAVPGMSVTFAGQLESLMEELDLRVEAENTKAGAVYDKGVQDVKSMKVLDLVKPTKYMLVVEKAPGESETVDRMMKQTADKLDTILAVFKPKTEWDDAKKSLVTKYTNPDINFKTSTELRMKAQKELLSLYEQTLVQQKRLVTLARKWVQEGVYSSGYYHGDLHAGNIMVDMKFKLAPDGSLARNEKGVPDLSENKGLTVIDFGNATKLNEDQQKNIIKMMAATAAKDVDAYLDGFYNLMSEGGRAKFTADRAKIANMVKTVFNLGTQAESGQRIALTLQMLQQMGHELPAPIFKFSQCQMRLQGTIDQMNALLRKIKNHYVGLLTSGTRDQTNLLFRFEAFEPASIFNNIMRTDVGSSITRLDGEITSIRQMQEKLAANPADPDLATSQYIPSNALGEDGAKNFISWIMVSGETNVADQLSAIFDNILTVATDAQKVRFKAAVDEIKAKVVEMKVSETFTEMSALKAKQTAFTSRRNELEAQRHAYTFLGGLRKKAKDYFDKGFDAAAIKARYQLLLDKKNAGRLTEMAELDEFGPLNALADELNHHEDILAYYDAELAKMDIAKIERELKTIKDESNAISGQIAPLREKMMEFYATVHQIVKTVDADYLDASLRYLKARRDDFEADMTKRNPSTSKVDTMNKAVGEVISGNKFASLMKIGVGTAVGYYFSGKLDGEQNPV